MKKLIVFFFAITPIFVLPTSKYIFHQQFNDMCMVAPMLNLQLMARLQGNGYDVKKLFARTRLEWFVFNQKPLIAWHKMFKTIADEAVKMQIDKKHRSKYQPLIGYFEDAIKEGPMMPHFYNKKGRFSFPNVSGALEIGLMPFGLVDYDALEKKKIKLLGLIPFFDLSNFKTALGVRIPLIFESDRYKMLYEDDGKIETKDIGLTQQQARIERAILDGLKHGNSIAITNKKTFDFVQRVTRVDLDEGKRESDVEGDEQLNIWKAPKKGGFLGMSNVGLLSVLGRGYRKSIDGKEKIYVPYMHGLYKVMLFQLGLGIENDEERASSREKNIISGMRDLLSKHEKNNPWRDELFRKDNFFQHELAKFFQDPKNRLLTRKIKATVDLSVRGLGEFAWRPWGLYRDLKYNKKYYRKKGDPYLKEQVEPFLPGDEQMLAYAVTNILRALFYGACSKGAAAFYKMTARAVPGLFSFNLFKKAVSKKVTFYLDERKWGFADYFTKDYWKAETDKISFLDSWQQLRDVLLGRWKEKFGLVWRKHWICFDGHGWVISFADEALELQREALEKSSDVDIDLYKKLGFTCIDSWMSSELETFYKF